VSRRKACQPVFMLFGCLLPVAVLAGILGKDKVHRIVCDQSFSNAKWPRRAVEAPILQHMEFNACTNARPHTLLWSVTTAGRLPSHIQLLW
jgi:hypothetical protein